MNAITCPSYGPPENLRFDEVERPTPQADEVLIRIQAASVNAGDRHLMRGEPFLVRLMYGLRRPKHPILGSDAAGTVEAVGPNVALLQPGDEVFGDLGGNGFGAFAEYACVPEGVLVPKPAELTFEEAAAVPLAAVTALQGLRQGGIRSGHRVLITGASGGVGTFAVQIAKAFGADVTGVCSTPKLELVRSIGADRVIDYTREDFTRTGRRYDLILDAGAHRSVFDCRRTLTPEGSYVMVGGATAPMLQAMLLGRALSRAGRQKLGALIAKPEVEDLARVGELLERGAVVPVIDRRYPLRQVPEAIRYLESGRARGKVVILVEGDGAPRSA